MKKSVRNMAQIREDNKNGDEVDKVSRLEGFNSQTAKLSREEKRKIIEDHVRKMGKGKKGVNILDELVDQINDRVCGRLLEEPTSAAERFLKVRVDEEDPMIV